MNFVGGYRNTMTLVLTGLDIEEKAAWAQDELFGVLGGRDQFAETDVRLLRFDTPDAPANEQATAHLRITVKDPDPRAVGRRFSNATMELALGGYAGFHTTTPPTPESEYGVYWPALVPAAAVTQVVVLPDGTTAEIGPTPPGPAPQAETPASRMTADRTGPGQAGPGGADPGEADPGEARPGADAGLVTVPLGRLCGARSGDKGGNANVGFWVRDPAAYSWLRSYLTASRLPRPAAGGRRPGDPAVSSCPT